MTNKLQIMKCIIVDDEPLAIEILESYVSRIDQLQVAGTFRNAGQGGRTGSWRHAADHAFDALGRKRRDGQAADCRYAASAHRSAEGQDRRELEQGIGRFVALGVRSENPRESAGQVVSIQFGVAPASGSKALS